MAFKLIPVDQIDHKVEIDTPQGNGRTKKEYLTVTFKKLSRSELKKASEYDEDSDIDDVEFMREHILDIKGLVDEEGAPVEYNPDGILEELMEMVHVSSAIIVGFWTAQVGRKAGKQKN